MKKGKIPYIRLLIIFAVFMLAGYLRDYLFFQVNAAQSEIYYDYSETQLADVFYFLRDWSYQHITWLKWIFTFFFCGVFAALSYLTVVFLNGSTLFKKIALLSYAALFVLAFLIYGVSMLLGMEFELYPLARFLVGILQSPVVVMLIIPVMMYEGKD